jgi:hypothetical protein
MAFDLDNYEPVAVRLGRWLEQCAAQGLTPRIITHLVHYTEQRCVFRAEAYTIDRDGREILHATGWAEETRGDGMVNRTSHLENCESSSVGRCMANLGLHGTLDPARRPSREEMAKVARMEGVSKPFTQHAGANARAGGSVGVTPGPSTISLASDKQTEALRRMGKRRGHTDDQQLEEALTLLLGQPVQLLTLTRQDASTAIGAWSEGGN